MSQLALIAAVLVFALVAILLLLFSDLGLRDGLGLTAIGLACLALAPLLAGKTWSKL